MIFVILSTSILMAAVLAAMSSVASLPEAIRPARPATTLSGVPISWAIPAASRPTVLSRSVWRSCSIVAMCALASSSMRACDSANCAHPIQAFGKLFQFVVGLQVERMGQITGADQPRFVNQLIQRPGNESAAQHEGNQSTDEHHAADEPGGSLDDSPFIGGKLDHGVGKFQTAVAIGCQGHGPVEIHKRGAGRIHGLDGHVFGNRSCGKTFNRRRGSIGLTRTSVEPNPADVQFAGLHLLDVLNCLPHAAIARSLPGFAQNRLHWIADRAGLVTDGLLKDALLLPNREIGIYGREQNVAQQKSQDELKGKPHIFVSTQRLGYSAAGAASLIVRRVQDFRGCGRFIFARANCPVRGISAAARRSVTSSVFSRDDLTSDDAETFANAFRLARTVHYGRGINASQSNQSSDTRASFHDKNFRMDSQAVGVANESLRDPMIVSHR